MQSKMINITDKNRNDIIRVYASRLLDDMNTDALYSFAYSMLIDSKEKMTNSNIEEEIMNYCPDILEE